VTFPTKSASGGDEAPSADHSTFEAPQNRAVDVSNDRIHPIAEPRCEIGPTLVKACPDTLVLAHERLADIGVVPTISLVLRAVLFVGLVLVLLLLW